jgi:hypothetical protein
MERGKGKAEAFVGTFVVCKAPIIIQKQNNNLLTKKTTQKH